MILTNEADILVKYLTGKACTELVLQNYRASVEMVDDEFTEKEKRIWLYCIKTPWALKFVDAALSFSKKHALVRRRIFIMFAITEVQVTYTDLFLPKVRPLVYHVKMFFVLLSLPVKVLAGKIFLWLI